MFPGNGWVLPAAVMLPNLIFFVFAPKDAPVPEAPRKAGIPMTVLERIGQAGIILIPFFYSLRYETFFEKGCLAVMVILLLFYYIGWLRYFTNGRKFRLLFSPMLGMPIPMAVFPVLFFIIASLNLWSLPLLAVSILLAVGHFYNTWKSWLAQK